MSSWKESKVIKFISKHAIHIEAVIVIICLFGLWFFMYQDHKIKERIELNCGWGEDNYYCYCEKSEAMEIKNKIENKGLDKLNVSGIYFEGG